MPNTNRSWISGAGLAAMAGMLAGCPYAPQGSGIADDEYTYWSEPHMPQTVSIVDTRTKQVIWTSEVPVGQQLVISFYRNTDVRNMNEPDSMRWQLMPLGQEYGELTNVTAVPPRGSRRIDTVTRKTPEPPAHGRLENRPASGGEPH